MRRLVLVSALAALACTGDVGPTGPAGAAGPAGPSGPGTRLVYSGTLNSSGSASVQLPAAAGTPTSPPIIGCYASEDGSFWRLLAGFTDSGISYCGFIASGSQLTAYLNKGGAGARYRIVVVY